MFPWLGRVATFSFVALFWSVAIMATVFGILFTLIMIPTNVLQIYEAPRILILIAYCVSLLAGLCTLSCFYFKKPFPASKFLDKHFNR